ncbi:hypothetical protein BJP36_36950 [Moorena producens JHB]|uniref:Uncharacterized protein n=1 Tax=Moorena producens (strain JHB) TaxID=1454205 RepID=A0A9Q9SU43_MOOP1|nr:hypothetical protein [Moorena producens]WAN69685.1 hypothetical protein BJP36_36950 [Moorena producens JHB]
MRDKQLLLSHLKSDWGTEKFAGFSHTLAIKTGSLSSSLKTSWEKVLDNKLRVELSGG